MNYKIWLMESVTSAQRLPQVFIDSVINSKGSSRPNEEENPLVSVYIPHVKGVSKSFKRIGNRCNTCTAFKPKHTLRSSLMKIRPERDPQQTAQCVCSIPCECGRSYIGETGRPLTVRLREHSYNVKEVFLEKLAQHAYKGGHSVDWDEAMILEFESNSSYRKYKQSAHMACSTNPISQPSLDIPPIWIPLISNEVSNSQR
jgi:hypothetical protein